MEIASSLVARRKIRLFMRPMRRRFQRFDHATAKPLPCQLFARYLVAMGLFLILLCLLTIGLTNAGTLGGRESLPQLQASIASPPLRPPAVVPATLPPPILLPPLPPPPTPIPPPPMPPLSHWSMPSPTPPSPPWPTNPPSVPPPASPPAAPVPAALIDIRRRFFHGVPASHLASAGLLVKVVDGMEDDAWQPWHACRSGWCSTVDHVSASVINHDLPHIYADVHDDLHVGFVLAATLDFHCSMLQDGGTVMNYHGGCEARCTCGQPGCYWCVYQPSQLREFVRDHMAGDRTTYNEVVILKEAWEAALPGSIEAVFCVHSDGCHQAREVHRRFLEAYGLSASDVPLLRYLHERGFMDMHAPSPPPMPSPAAPRAPPPVSPAAAPLSAAAALVALLETRFWAGRPSNVLSEAGVLLRQFDRISELDASAPWLPCSESRWCARYRSQWPSSIINSEYRQLYYTDCGGLIIDPLTTDFFCAYGGDGNSMAHDCGGGPGDGIGCIPGCYPDGQQCQQVGHDWNCAWPPSMLREAMEAQLARGRPSGSHNEIVIDTRSIVANLPGAILGFFYEVSSSAAVEMRQAFLATYGLSADQVPLVQVNLNARGGDGDAVIRLHG